MQNRPSLVATFASVKFPFDLPPEILVPERTVLDLADRLRAHIHLWCYLRRKSGRGGSAMFDCSSLSSARVAVMPAVLDRLSKWCRHDNARPASVDGRLKCLSSFLAWADQAEHHGQFERVLSDPEIAFQALRDYHSYLRARLQSHQLLPGSVAKRDHNAIACLSVIHDRNYLDRLEPLAYRQWVGTAAPVDDAVQAFVSMVQAVFDSAAGIVLREIAGENSLGSARCLHLSAGGDPRIYELPECYTDARVMDLACVAFAVLVLADSGANLSVLQGFEEPEDLNDQLSQPDKVSLRYRAVKFRAGGQLVPVHLTALTATRLPTYLRIRKRFIEHLGCDDIGPLYVQGGYSDVYSQLRSVISPTSVQPLARYFLQSLRKKFSSIGAKLPPVTLRQLRAYKQQHLVRRETVAVAAAVMGHSVETAVRAYCKAQEGLRAVELGQYLGSLEKTILASSAGNLASSATESVPAGACADYGNPSPFRSTLQVQPDCNKVEGCFFCDNYRLHADEVDLRKLMSCRAALKRIVPLQFDSVIVERVYLAIVDRIDALLGEIRLRVPKIYEDVRYDVDEGGNLTSYWSSKLQQLHLLGMLSDRSGEAL
ncbi:hypothetical protein AT984_04250 [Paucibacter sp. KCTC 42545]|nr:hypothetical protein AT984_04250 [Paucibacter sp. KCTC 42545]